MLVSIIIPLFNREYLITETLNSIKEQSYTNWECIIIDDHSTDNSLELVRELTSTDKRFIVTKRPNDRQKGANACRNYGFEISKGNFINWFDSDDIMHPSFIESKIRAFKRILDLDSIISKTIFFKANLKDSTTKETRTHLTENTLQDFLTLKIAWYLPDVMWRRAFIEDKNLFDEYLLAGQDRDFHSRMLLHNPKMLVLDEHLTYYRQHEDNITSKVDSIKDNRIRTSLINSVSKLMNKVKEKGMLSNEIKEFYFDSMMKNLPYVISDKKELGVLIDLLKTLSFFNAKIAFKWLKFGTAFLSLRAFGRGGKLLK